MIRLSVTAKFDTAFIDKLEPLLAAEAETALDKSAAAILNRLRTTYLAEQDPYGKPWTPSKAGIKRRAKGGTGTLFNTGNLYRSIQLSSSTPGERVISTDVGYGAKLQAGTDYSGIPRPFLELTPEHIDMATKTFVFQVRKLFKGLSA